jgi:hypothetical protein
MLFFILRTGAFTGTRCRDRGGSCRSAGTGGPAREKPHRFPAVFRDISPVYITV